MKTKTRDFDKQFDEGGDITRHLDLTKVSRPNIAPRRVNVDFPEWMVERLDQEANRVGVTRQSIIKMWLSERMEKAASQR